MTDLEKEVESIIFDLIDNEDLKINDNDLLIPNGFLHIKKNKHFTKSSVFFTDFQVKKENLKEMLDEYAGALEGAI